MKHYLNFTYDVELSFDKGSLDTKTEIVWIVIIAIGLLMIVGLIVVWRRQSGDKTESRNSMQESLLTVEPEFKSAYINRSSVDPGSIRGTVDMEESPQMQKETIEEPEAKQAEEEKEVKA